MILLKARSVIFCKFATKFHLRRTPRSESRLSRLINPVACTSRLITAAMACLISASAFAQEAAPEPVTEETPLPDGQSATSAAMETGIINDPLVTALAEDPKPRWRFLIEDSVGAMYDSNIFAEPHDEKDDFVISISPLLTYIYGDFRQSQNSFLLVSYAPTARFFLDGSTEDTLDHDALFEARIATGKFSTDLKLRFQALSDSEVDVGTRTTRYVYSGTLGLHYDLTGQTSADLNFFFTAYDYETRFDSQESIVKGWLNYQITPKIMSGFGFGAGYLESDGSSSQTYEQASVRAIYVPTSKIELRLEAGVEVRQLDTDDRVSPLWAVGATYEPFDGAAISLDFTRKVRASAALAGRNYDATALVLKFRQRLWQKYAFILKTGYTNADYYITDFDEPSDREDDYFFIRPSFEYSANKWLKVEVFYQFRENDSNTERFGFAGHQVGFMASFSF